MMFSRTALALTAAVAVVSACAAWVISGSALDEPVQLYSQADIDQLASDERARLDALAAASPCSRR